MEGKVKVYAKKVYRGFSLEVDLVFHGGLNVILGPSGSGKSTLLRIMAGLERPDEGFMSCCGEIFFDTTRNLWVPPQKRKVGLVFQENNLLPNLNILENVAFALRSKNKALKVLKDFGLEDLAYKRPNQISGGQKQKVAFVRAVAFNPRILLLDEPFSSLDYRAKIDLINFLKKIASNIPCVVVTHDPVEAFLLGHRVVLLEKGKVTGQGGPELVKEYFKEIEDLLHGIEVPTGGEPI